MEGEEGERWRKEEEGRGTEVREGGMEDVGHRGGRERMRWHIISLVLHGKASASTVANSSTTACPPWGSLQGSSR